MRKNNGFTLLEVLVTLLIMSFALLGIAGILANSIKNDQSAYSRSQAVLLAADIIDRMRANRTTAEIGPTTPYDLPLATTCAKSPASVNAIAQTDLTEWCAALTAALPSGTGSVTRDATSGKVTIVVQWDDSRGAGGVAAQQITIETRL